jgi:cysteine-rich repeat protein
MLRRLAASTLAIAFLAMTPALAVQCPDDPQQDCFAGTVYVRQSQQAVALELCETVRIQETALTPPASGDFLDGCIQVLLNRALISIKASMEKAVQESAAAQARQEAVRSFSTLLVAPGFVTAVCGDGVISTEFNEDCDDGNSASGDGCDSLCNVEVPEAP